jgi:hypothetical protein
MALEILAAISLLQASSQDLQVFLPTRSTSIVTSLQRPTVSAPPKLAGMVSFGENIKSSDPITDEQLHKLWMPGPPLNPKEVTPEDVNRELGIPGQSDGEKLLIYYWKVPNPIISEVVFRDRKVDSFQGGMDCKNPERHEAGQKAGRAGNSVEQVVSVLGEPTEIVEVPVWTWRKQDSFISAYFIDGSFNPIAGNIDGPESERSRQAALKKVLPRDQPLESGFNLPVKTGMTYEQVSKILDEPGEKLPVTTYFWNSQQHTLEAEFVNDRLTQQRWTPIKVPANLSMCESLHFHSLENRAKLELEPDLSLQEVTSRLGKPVSQTAPVVYIWRRPNATLHITFTNNEVSSVNRRPISPVTP